MMRNILPIMLVLLFAESFAQNTVGLLLYDFSQTYNGYNLIYPHNQPNVYLLNNCGEVVHTWEDEDTLRPGNTAYLTEDGRLIKTKRGANVADDPIWAGGGGATVEIRSWENDLLWTFTLNDSLRRLHHDIQPMPNGNILMIAWEVKTEDEAIAAGRNPELLFDGELWPDYVIEVQPIGADSFDIVWEWHVWDHLVQDFDPKKPNFGDPAEHPGKLDINFQTNDGRADWLHCNAIDYNSIYDQVMICCPFLREVWIIDHSTTTEEAAGSTGGMSGKGGDFIYRWGNDQVFRQGGPEDQKLFNPHDAQWIDDFIQGSNPDFGKISVYNNQAGSNYSTVNIFEPFFDKYVGYGKIGEVFTPAEFDWTYIHPDTLLTYSTGLSSVQVLPNGNTLIVAGRTGYSYELNTDEEIIWEYRTPLIGGMRAEQGEELSINDNLTFRIRRYPRDYPGFDGRDLTPKGFIELNPDVDFCDITTSTDMPEDPMNALIYPNPASEMLTVEWLRGGMGIVECYDLQGRLMHRENAYGGRTYISVGDWMPGLYVVRINGMIAGKVIIAY